MEFDIEYWIEEINKSIPLRYFKRNIRQFIFVTYINHSVVLNKGQHYDSVFMFLKRACEYLDAHDNIDSEYLNSTLGYMKANFEFLIQNNLVKEDLIKKYEKQLKLTLYKKHRAG